LFNHYYFLGEFVFDKCQSLHFLPSFTLKNSEEWNQKGAAKAAKDGIFLFRACLDV